MPQTNQTLISRIQGYDTNLLGNREHTMKTLNNNQLQELEISRR